MAQANRRKQENERRLERQIQKERDEEGDEFADKESYVTPSYKKKLEQMKLFEEEELRLGMLEGNYMFYTILNILIDPKEIPFQKLLKILL